ncbi:MAG: 4Fe-4S dicluster domain-containing protein [gamma proteobacterium symbiont of Bathyaustriella thionipta]|nr:4Fe-4S dicluster domain-containing protein [gamma proteobacterium symbiont of Bathyaustriella thionipta]MCU7948495.1 4Fe-4S dicluster domain-containing protein [gamma proteobacterium symbiont of Bathyaustriella thionipta]MCU7952719.1 4Fe-4S dicluster domain-containing protein [gamma proteobacterium symbiont of Bathyaustriella thionipta]MCU7955495.1 4Fe-4S dicluster domain-containing protein [gamma proteobacterium symbiont of Bathyaustriella thionipta]MCU7966362.1 4Fe-4S dicluster domain-cont
MNNSGKTLLKTITQEIRLPEINADDCVHALCNHSDCHACVAACPTDAWILNEDNLGLDIEACNGCGLCIPACPVGALHIDFPWTIRTLGYRMIALFACEKSDVKQTNGVIPCVHALGSRQLLQLYKAGIEHILLATDECHNCAYFESKQQPETIDSRVEQLNNLLIERNKPTIKILKHPYRVWKKIFYSDEAIFRGTQLSRRNFLRGGGQQFRQQLVIIDPLNLAEYRTIPPGQLLPESENTEIKWPWVPILDSAQCNGCNACMRLCPTNALQLVDDEDQNSALYKIEPINCTGCNLCCSVCEVNAIRINSWSYTQIDAIHLSQNKCSACGNTFYLPEQNTQSEHDLCRICQNHNHSSKLFQVLD